MKKLIIILLASVALIACKKNEEIHFDQTASQGIAGTYVGTWSRVQQNTTDTVSGEGTITFVASDSLANVATITAICANPEVNRTGIVNVVHSDYEYVFYNNSDKPEAGFGTAFSGRVYKDGSADMQYTVEEKVGRKRNIYNFSFKGIKQNTPN